MFCWNYAVERWKWFDMQKKVWNEVSSGGSRNVDILHLSEVFMVANSESNLLVSVCRITCMTAVTMDMGVTPTAMGRGQHTPLVSWSKAAIRRWTSASSRRNGRSWTKAAAGTSWWPHSEWCVDRFKTSVTACCIVNILQYNSIISLT